MIPLHVQEQRFPSNQPQLQRVNAETNLEFNRSHNLAVHELQQCIYCIIVQFSEFA